MEAGETVVITRDLRLGGKAEGEEVEALSESEVLLDGWPAVVGQDVEVSGASECQRCGRMLRE